MINSNQKSSQNFSNETLKILLATSEVLAIKYGFNGPKKYIQLVDFNDMNKSKNVLIKELSNLLECFKSSYNAYVKIYGNYDYPNEFLPQQIIYDVNKWKSYIPNDLRYYYDSILEIVDPEKNIIRQEYIPNNIIINYNFYGK